MKKERRRKSEYKEKNKKRKKYMSMYDIKIK
jgi:hypothetical protein